MILTTCVILIMLATAWSQYRNGLFSSVAMLIKVFVAGMVAFGFWEPIAAKLEPTLVGSAIAGSEDLIALVGLFSVTLLILRIATNYLSQELIDEHGWLQFFGGAGVGLITGYFLAGFLVCAVQTLPIEEKFLGFQPPAENESSMRQIFPPDRVWLAMMRHGSAYPFRWQLQPNPKDESALESYIIFDRDATFELRYQRFRRGIDGKPPMPYQGEFDREIGKMPP
jgi:uncharacterized membrane protein required for colicin V production